MTFRPIDYLIAGLISGACTAIMAFGLYCAGVWP